MGQLKQLIEKYGSELKSKLKDPVFFVEEIIFKPRGWKLPEYGKEWLKITQKHKRTNFLAFRTSGKTEILLVDQPIWRAFKQKNFEGIVTSSSLAQSTDVLKRIKDTVLNNEVLRTAVPSAKSATWSKTSIQFKNGSRIRCLPYSDNLRGYHVDWVGCDEIGEYRDHDIMHSVVAKIVLAKNGDINCIGTPKSKIDLPHKLRKNDAWKSMIYPAYTDKVNLFKQRYPDWKIVKKGGRVKIYDKVGNLIDDMDNLTWSREFMCVPLGSDDKLFPYDLIEQSFNYNLSMSTERNTNSSYYLGIDFALSAESSADYTVVVVIERTKDGLFIVSNMERWKGMSYNAQKVRIAEIMNFYKPVRAVLDESSFGASFIDDIRRMVSGVSIEGFKFSAGLYTNKKQELITMLRSAFESNWEIYTSNEKVNLPEEKKKFIIPRERTDTRTMKLSTDIIEELMGFGMKYDEVKHTIKFEGIGTHDDIVVALALANYACRGSVGLKPVLSRGSYGYHKMIFGKTH